MRVYAAPFGSSEDGTDWQEIGEAAYGTFTLDESHPYYEPIRKNTLTGFSVTTEFRNVPDKFVALMAGSTVSHIRRLRNPKRLIHKGRKPRG